MIKAKFPQNKKFNGEPYQTAEKLLNHRQFKL